MASETDGPGPPVPNHDEFWDKLVEAVQKAHQFEVRRLLKEADDVGISRDEIETYVRRATGDTAFVADLQRPASDARRPTRLIAAGVLLVLAAGTVAVIANLKFEEMTFRQATHRSLDPTLPDEARFTAVARMFRMVGYGMKGLRELAGSGHHEAGTARQALNRVRTDLAERNEPDDALLPLEETAAFYDLVDSLRDPTADTQDVVRAIETELTSGVLALNRLRNRHRVQATPVGQHAEIYAGKLLAEFGGV